MIRVFDLGEPSDHFSGSPVTPSLGSSHSPAPSPDLGSLAFVMGGDIHVVPLSGGPATRLTSLNADFAHLAWSRDGTTLSFLACPGEDSCYAATVPSTGGAVRTGPEVARNPVLPRGASVVPNHSGDSLFIHWPNEKGLLIWNGDQTATLFKEIEIEPHVVSPDGTRLFANQGRSFLVALSLADCSVDTIVAAAGFRVGESSFFLGRGLAWSDDGWVYFERKNSAEIGGVVGNGAEGWRIPADGGDPEPALRRSDGSPYWGRSAIALSANGELGFWTESARAQRDVYVADAIRHDGGG